MIVNKMARRKKTFQLTPVLLILFLGASILVSILAVKRVTQLRSRAYCDDAGCANVQNGGYWMITECNSPDADGDQQLCNFAGRSGSCRSVPYCCPAPGAQWSTNMTPCATPAPPVTNTPYPTSTPYPTYTPYPTVTPLATSTPLPTVTRTPTRKATVKPRSTAIPTKVVFPTATPTPGIPLPESCNDTCKTDSDCKGGLICVFTSGYSKSCRNRSCQLEDYCLCPGFGALGLDSYATPTPDRSLGGSSAFQIPVSVAQFTNSRGEVGAMFTLSGRTDPGAKVVITISPDGVGGEVIADSTGGWKFRLPKKLESGKKQLLVVASKSDGSTGQVRQDFAVVASKGLGVLGVLLIVMIIAALGFGGYVYFKSM